MLYIISNGRFTTNGPPAFEFHYSWKKVNGVAPSSRGSNVPWSTAF
jgi:hypothetical protein